MVVAISHEKTLNSPCVPKTVICHVCGKIHDVKENGTGIQYVKCPKDNKLYLVGLYNKDVRSAMQK